MKLKSLTYPYVFYAVVFVIAICAKAHGDPIEELIKNINRIKTSYKKLSILEKKGMANHST